MQFLKMIVAIGFLLLLINPCFSSNEEYISKDLHQATLFSQNVLNMDRDTSVFLHSLSVLRAENAGAEVVHFMEYQLDEIVCAAGQFIDEMSPSQKKSTLKFLREIKEYRTKYPRQRNVRIDPTKFSKYFEPFNKSYADRADKILAALN